MKVYIASSWKQRGRVRDVAERLITQGHEVYDFTNPLHSPGAPPMPPENYPEQFDPEKHIYGDYLDVEEWRQKVNRNRRALEWCDLVLLLLPCGLDAHADWAYAVGQGKHSLIAGHPPAGERTPSHLWANAIVETDELAISMLRPNSIFSTIVLGRPVPA